MTDSLASEETTAVSEFSREYHRSLVDKLISLSGCDAEERDVMDKRRDSIRDFLERLFYSPMPQQANRSLLDDQQVETKYCDKISQLVAQNGPSSKEDFYKIFRELHGDIKDGYISETQFLKALVTLGPAISKEALMGRILWRPRGYAGDFETLEKIYNHEVSLNPEITKWDEVFHCPGAESVIMRLNFMVEQIMQAIYDKKIPLVADVACGGARLAKEVFARMEREEIDPEALGGIVCFDGDKNALKFAERRQWNDKLILMKDKNVLKGFKGEDMFDMIVSMGLHDYFDTETSTIMKRRYFRAAKKKGGVVNIGNFAKGHVDMPWTACFNWELWLRNTADMQEETKEAARKEGLSVKSEFTSLSADEVSISQHIESVKLT